MRKYITTILFISLITLSYGQTNIGEVLKTMPDRMIPGFAQEQRNLIISDSVGSVQKYALGTIRLNEKSQNYISLNTSSVGSIQIKLLSLINKSQIICFIRTVCSKACNSTIEFYTLSWDAIPSESLMPQTDASIFIKPKSLENKEFTAIYNRIDMHPIWVTASPDKEEITLHYSPEGYISKADFTIIEPHLKSELPVLMWDKSKFVFKK